MGSCRRCYAYVLKVKVLLRTGVQTGDGIGQQAVQIAVDADAIVEQRRARGRRLVAAADRHECGEVVDPDEAEREEPEQTGTSGVRMARTLDLFDGAPSTSAIACAHASDCAQPPAKRSMANLTPRVVSTSSASHRICRAMPSRTARSMWARVVRIDMPMNAPR